MMDETAIEAALGAYGRELRATLPADDLSRSVAAALRRADAPARPRSRRRMTAARVALVAAVIVLVLASAAYAGYRLVFAAGPVTVHREPPPAAAAVGARLALGQLVRPEDPRIHLDVVVPHVTGLPGEPQWWFDRRATDQVSLTLPPQPGLPEIGTSGVGLLIQEFDGEGAETIRKYLTRSTQVDRVRIGSSTGVFLTGGDHVLFYLDRNGRYVTSVGRLVGNALIFQRGGLTIRIEGQLPRDKMLEVASSLR